MHEVYNKFLQRLRKVAPTKGENFLFLLAIRLFGTTFFFGLILFLTNFFPQEVIGEFEYARPLVILLSSVLLFGFDRSILYYAGRYGEKVAYDTYRKMVLFILLVGLVLAVVPVVLPFEVMIFSWQSPSDAYLIIKSIISIMVYALVSLNMSFFYSQGRNTSAEFLTGFLRYVPFALGAVILFITRDFELLADVFLLGFAPVALVSTWYCLVTFNPKSESVESLRYGSIIKKSLPMAVSTVGFWLLLSIDVFILKQYVSFSRLAVYAIPVKFVGLIAIVQTLIQNVVSTEFSRLYSADKMKYLQAVVKKYTRIIFILTIVPTALIFLFSPFVLSFFGPSYVDGAGVLRIMMAGSIISSMGGCMVGYFNMTGKQNALQFILLIAVVVNGVLNYILIPTDGITGAAWASFTSLSFLIITTSMYAYLKDRILLIVH